MLRLTTSLLAFITFASLMAAGCTGTVTGMDPAKNDPAGDKADTADVPLTPEEEEQLARCLGDGEAGGACEVTADCDSPLVCVDNVCIGPKDPSYTCDTIEGVYCEYEGETCVNGLCVLEPGACETLDDCPLGYLCSEKQCVPEREGEACADPGPGPDLTGEWHVDSVLRLREGLPDVVDTILDVSEKARNIINGDVDLGLPKAVEFVTNAIIAGIIRQFVPPYAVDIVTALGDMSDILDDMHIDGTLTLIGEVCSGNYRGIHKWNTVTFTFKGQEISVHPDDLPGVDNVEPEAFAARYHCGDLLIDKHRIHNSMGGLIRWVMDTGANALTGRSSIEDALASIVNCDAVGATVNDYVQTYCPLVYCPSVKKPARKGCEAAVKLGVKQVTKAIDKATVKMSLIKLRAVIDTQTGIGTWYGSLVGGDFTGTLRASR